MKRIYLLVLSLTFSAVLLFVACSNITLFNKVQVKAAPSIYAPLGGTKIEVKDYLTIEKISEMLGKDSKFKVYNYTGDSDSTAMTFLLEYPLMEMPLNFDEYLGKLDMSKMNTSIPKMDFSIPTIDIASASQTVAVPGGEDFKGQTLDSDSVQGLNQAIGQNKSLAIEERRITLKSEGLKSAVFADGNKITLSLKPTVEGIRVSSANISIALPGDSNPVKFEADANESGSYTANLGGKTITNGDFVIKGTISVSSTVKAGTTIPAEGIGVKIEMGMDMNQGFKSVTMEVPADTNLDQTINTPLPEEMTKLVSSITFTKVGAAVELKNGLPKGNDINVTVSSTTLKITDKKETFPAQSTTSHEFLGENVTLQPATQSEIDMKMKVELPGYDSGANTFTVQNVKPGEKYSVGGSVAFEVDWKEATVKTDKPFEGSYPAEGGDPMKLSDLWDKIPKGISFKEIGAYLYMDAPMDIKMKGYMTMNGQSLWGSKDAEETLSESTAPTGPAEGDWTEYVDPTKASMDLSPKLLEIMKGRPDSLSFNYSLNTEGVTIQKGQISGEQSLRAVMLMKLPLALEVDSSQMVDKPENLPFEGKGVPIDVFTLAKVYSDEPDANNDLFKREEPWSLDDEINKLLDQLQSMKMELDYTNELGMTLGAWFYDSGTGISKHFTLEQGTKTMELNFGLEEIKKIIKAYPFSPKLYVFIPDTTPETPFVLNRDGKFDFKLTVAAAADVDYTYDLKGGN
ncbi:MAG: hypothetical protein IJW57_05735 [Spirochaetaceae bacterium]|nr:hypothetical protein [Spirochaetaceae bacterium]